MKKFILIMSITVISLLIIGYIAYANISILPYDLINSLRTFRDYVQETTRSIERTSGIPLKAQVYDEDYVVKEFVTGLSQPTTMTFVGDDILILEKNSGHVKLIRDGKASQDPILDFEVGFTNESGLLGIVSNNNYVYIFVSESETDGGKTIGNNIYRYKWDGANLVNKTLLNTLSSESSWHNGGAMTVDMDGQVFAVIGDQMGGGREDLKNDFRILQNVNNGTIDDSGVIIKVGYDDNIVQPRLSDFPLEHYRAIGIRNSFGLAIDPFTGNLWDTENGPDHHDEINLVPDNFNSGWAVVMGPATEEQISKIPSLGSFEYGDPKFSWERTITPTGLEFVNSDNFSKYEGDLIVASCNFGNLFKFELNEQRNGFSMNTPHLQDLVVNYVIQENDQNNSESMQEILFGEGFGCLTDIEFGPDGNIYLVSISDNAIYVISPKN